MNFTTLIALLLMTKLSFVTCFSCWQQCCRYGGYNLSSRTSTPQRSAPAESSYCSRVIENRKLIHSCAVKSRFLPHEMIGASIVQLQATRKYQEDEGPCSSTTSDVRTGQQDNKKKEEEYVYWETMEKIRGQLIDPNDYAIVDSIHLPPSSRPSLSQVLNNPRDLVSIPVIVVGLVVSTCNIFGWYNDIYAQIELVAVGLGIISALAYTAQMVTGYGLSANVRRGVVDESSILLYAASYTAASSWLSLRAGILCPSWLPTLDPIMGVTSLLIFLFSLFAPIFALVGGTGSAGGIFTVWNRSLVQLARGFSKGTPSESSLLSSPKLSPVETLRAQGLVAIGVVGCLFAPDALAFALGGQDWWGRVYDLHPSQRMLESSTALFGMFATEASMLGHRLAKAGYISFRYGCVPFGVGACMVLAVIPCISSLHWLGDDVSFFSFYTD